MKVSLSRIVDWALVGALAVSAIIFLSRKLSGPEEGKLAARFDLPVAGSSGARFRLDEHRGKPVLIEVFASWCGVCRRTAPALAEAFEKHGGAGKVAFVGVSIDGSLDDAARIKSEWGIPYDVTVDDGSVSRNYRIKSLPTFVLVGRGGSVERVSVGALSRSELDRWLTDL